MQQELTRESVRIAGPRGALAGELSYGDGEVEAACLLVNPHPHMGGQMGNNLIAHLAGQLPQRGVATLRFDYAGVGESEGGEVDVYASMAQFWETGVTPADPLMIEDARAAAGWLRGQVAADMFLAGYSFGAYAAASIVDEDAAGIVLVSPTLSRHDFSPLTHCRVPKLIVYSNDDFATPAVVTQQWVSSLQDVAGAHCLTGGNHFFRGQEEAVARICGRFIAGRSGGSR